MGSELIFSFQKTIKKESKGQTLGHFRTQTKHQTETHTMPKYIFDQTEENKTA